MALTNIQKEVMANNYFRNRAQYFVRPHHFWLNFTAPPAVSVDQAILDDMTYYAKGVHIPDYTMGKFEISWMGLKFIVGGDPENTGTFDIEYLYDIDSYILGFVQTWQEAIVDSKNPTASNVGRHRIQQYKADFQVAQLGMNDEVIKNYLWTGVFAEAVNGYDVNHETQNEAAVFTVTWSYDWWYPDKLLNVSAPKPGSQMPGGVSQF